MRRRDPGPGLKIVVTGPFAAGKTTFISTISEVAAVSTERPISDASAERKGQTTVAMDYGRIALEPDLVLNLFGTPGQDRFEFMWDILGSGMLGFVLLLDGSRPDSAAEARGILSAFRAMSTAPYVVAVTRAGQLGSVEQDRIRAALELDAAVPVLACDATDRESVKAVLLALLHALLEGLDRPAATR